MSLNRKDPNVASRSKCITRNTTEVLRWQGTLLGCHVTGQTWAFPFIPTSIVLKWTAFQDDGWRNIYILNNKNKQNTISIPLPYIGFAIQICRWFCSGIWSRVSCLTSTLGNAPNAINYFRFKHIINNINYRLTHESPLVSHGGNKQLKP